VGRRIVSSAPSANPVGPKGPVRFACPAAKVIVESRPPRSATRTGQDAAYYRGAHRISRTHAYIVIRRCQSANQHNLETRGGRIYGQRWKRLSGSDFFLSPSLRRSAPRESECIGMIPRCASAHLTSSRHHGHCAEDALVAPLPSSGAAEAKESGGRSCAPHKSFRMKWAGGFCLVSPGAASRIRPVAELFRKGPLA